MESLADMMETGQEQLFHEWRERVQQRHAPGPLSEPELADQIPDFLRQVIAALRREEEGVEPKTHRVGPLGWEHGEQRFLIGFTLSNIVREYGVLHDCIFELVENRGHGLVRLEEARILAQCFTRAIAEAVAHYLRMRERELQGGEAAPAVS